MYLQVDDFPFVWGFVDIKNPNNLPKLGMGEPGSTWVKIGKVIFRVFLVGILQ